MVGRCNTVERGGFNGPYLLAFSELVKSLAVHGTSQTLHCAVTSQFALFYFILFHQLGQTLQVDDVVCCAMKLKMTACKGLWKTNLCGYAFYGLFSFLRRK